MPRRPPPLVLALALAAAAATTLAPAPARSVCSPGSPIYHDCFGVGPGGCCTMKNSSAGIIVTTVQWCDSGWLCSMVCNPYFGYCGWLEDYTSGFAGYDCIDYPTQDPTGANPYLCDIPCGDVGPQGCCEGQTLLRYCKDGTLNFLNCADNPAGGQYCGWDPIFQAYNCTIGPIQGPADFPYTCGQAPCQKQCGGKQCGPDGCGGSCGACPAGWDCTAAGTCQKPDCTPDCTGRECGTDKNGCGFSCGTCVPPRTCDGAYQCTCQSSCVAKHLDCGPDGCGGSCGTCPGEAQCGVDGRCAQKPCIPSCKNPDGSPRVCGSDGCGGACGTCQPPKVCGCQGTCQDAPAPECPDLGGPPDVPDPGTAGEDAAAGGTDLGRRNRCPEGMVLKYNSCVMAPIHPGEGSSCRASPQGSPAAWVELLVLIAGILGTRRRAGHRRSVGDSRRFC